ncbi:hypothetical protein NMY22_g11428 [Coprinellus aureogranulatus]|nr:hypothetical protein NMY22_g11428 [Coprinellus aureogranulatus]
MTRGRKKDLTIPPTRALVQQRDYRARKAHYVAELEERVRKAEEENAQLRKDLELARASLSVPYLFNPLATELSAELQHNMSLVASSLAKFQDFARQHPLPEGPSRGLQLPPIQNYLRPQVSARSPTSSAQDSPTLHPSPPSLHLSPVTPHTVHHPRPLHVPEAVPPRGLKRLCREDSPPSSRSESGGASGSSRDRFELQRSSTPESECCGGMFDCSELCEEEHEHTPSHGVHETRSPPRYQRLDERFPPPYRSHAQFAQRDP